MRRKQRQLNNQTDDIGASWRRELPGRDLTILLLAIFIMRMGRMVDDTYDRICRAKFGISGADMRVLFALRRAGKPYALRPTDLYRALVVTSGAITKQVDRLSKLGLVERTAASETGGTVVRLTTKGFKSVTIALELVMSDSVIAMALSDLSSAEKSSAYALCEHMLLHLDKSRKVKGSA